MPRCGCVEHGLEYITLYVQKHRAHLADCSGSTLVRDRVTVYIGELHPITVYRTGFGVCAVLVLSVIMCSFTSCVSWWESWDYYWDIYGHSFILNYTFRLSETRSGSANAQLPGYFYPWTFCMNIGLNMLPSDSFMSCLHSLLGYPTGDFQALQLIVLTVFGAVVQPLASCMLVHIGYGFIAGMVQLHHTVYCFMVIMASWREHIFRITDTLAGASADYGGILPPNK